MYLMFVKSVESSGWGRFHAAETSKLPLGPILNEWLMIMEVARTWTDITWLHHWTRVRLNVMRLCPFWNDWKMIQKKDVWLSRKEPTPFQEAGVFKHFVKEYSLLHKGGPPTIVYFAWICKLCCNAIKIRTISRFSKLVMCEQLRKAMHDALKNE